MPEGGGPEEGEVEVVDDLHDLSVLDYLLRVHQRCFHVDVLVFLLPVHIHKESVHCHVLSKDLLWLQRGAILGQRRLFRPGPLHQVLYLDGRESCIFLHADNSWPGDQNVFWIQLHLELI